MHATRSKEQKKSKGSTLNTQINIENLVLAVGYVCRLQMLWSVRGRKKKIRVLAMYGSMRSERDKKNGEIKLGEGQVATQP